jgi:hypothetical protein
MIFTQPLSFIREFVEEWYRGIREYAPNRKLSTAQRYGLSSLAYRCGLPGFRRRVIDGSSLKQSL